MVISELLRGIRPVLNDGVYAYAVIPHGRSTLGLDCVATFREREGVTLVLPEEEAGRAGLPVVLRVAWISLEVRSDLQAVGFTAAFSGALAADGIACNVMAAAYHDHVFVPWEQAEQAIACLQRLQQR